MSEEQYKHIVKGRLQRDDFVVDDGAEGYIDNGMDDWSGGDEEFEDYEEERSRSTRFLVFFILFSHIPDKKSKSNGQPSKPKPKPKPKRPDPPAPSISAYRPVVSAEQEADFMSSILGNMDSIVPDPLPKRASRKRKPSPAYDSDAELGHTSYRQKSYGGFSSDGPLDDSSAIPIDEFSSPNKRVRMDDANVIPAAEDFANLDVYSSDDFSSYDDIDMDAFNDLDDDIEMKPVVKKEEVDHTISNKGASKATTTKKKEEPDVKPAWLSVYDSLTVETEDTLGPIGSNGTSKASSNISALEADGSLRFFWLDYLELEGKLYFTGKLKDKTSGEWASCCVTVEGIERNLFVLPREKRVELDDDGNMHETDVVPSEEDIDDDFDIIRKQMKIKSYRGKFVKRKYVFGDKDAPRGESTWMKVVYGFNGASHYCIPLSICNDHFQTLWYL